MARRGHWRAIVRLGVLPVGAGLVCAALLWWTLPYLPRAVLQTTQRHTVQGFSPDSRWLVTTDFVEDDNSATHRGPVRFWDVETGQQTAEFLDGDHTLSAAEVDPNGKLLFVREVSPALVRVISIASGEEVATLPAPHDGQLGFSFLLVSPDGRTLVYDTVVEDQLCIRLWDIPTRRMRASIQPNTDKRAHYVPRGFSPDGKLFAEHYFGGKTQDEVVIRDAMTGDVVRTIKGYQGLPSSLVFSSDHSKVAIYCFPSRSGAKDCTYVWDIKSGRRLLALDDTVSPTFVDGDTALVAITTDRDAGRRAVTRWDLEGNEPPRELLPIPLANGGDTDLCFMEDAPASNGICLMSRGGSYEPSLLDKAWRWAGVRDNGLPDLKITWTLVDMVNWKELATLSADSMELSPDGRTLAISDRKHTWTQLYDVPPRQPWSRIVVLSALVAAAVFVAGRRWYKRWSA